MIVRELRAADAPACDAVLASLPDFLGLQSGIDASAEAVRSCTEISWMAVQRDRRAAGIGTALVERLVEDERAAARGSCS